MKKLENIENEVRRLTDAELATFRKWFIELTPMRGIASLKGTVRLASLLTRKKIIV